MDNQNRKISRQLTKSGIPTKTDLKPFLPSSKRKRKGAYALIECFEEIPCDPCFSACPFKSVKEFANLNDIPVIDFKKCTGCGLCVPECPGLAIFLINEDRDDGKATITIPYEFLPLPEKGEQVWALNRVGEIEGEAKVVEVKTYSKKNHTTVVTLLIPREKVLTIRHFRRKDQNEL
ncbi:MAG: Electron transport complex subunit RsxB [candidate division WS2 bacterium]|nr:Electron transport complex subunit RsxB [Candidatus Psychracetigena formicireducens]